MVWAVKIAFSARVGAEERQENTKFPTLSPSNNASYNKPPAQVQVRKTNKTNIRFLIEIDTGLRKTPAHGIFEEVCQST